MWGSHNQKLAYFDYVISYSLVWTPAITLLVDKHAVMLHVSVFAFLTVSNALTLLISPWSHPSGPSQPCLTTGSMVNPEDSESKRLGQYRGQGLCSLPLAFWKDGLSSRSLFPGGRRDFVNLYTWEEEKAWLSSALPPLGNELPKGSIFHCVSQSIAHQGASPDPGPLGLGGKVCLRSPVGGPIRLSRQAISLPNSALTGNSGGALIPKDKREDLLSSYCSQELPLS